MAAPRVSLLNKCWACVGVGSVMNKKTVAGIALGRKLHLVDVENLCGFGELSESAVAQAREAYLRQVEVGEDDIVIVASGARNQEALMFGWSDARVIVRKGIDGADLALCDEILCSGYCDRFSEVVVASGDHIFAEHIAVVTGKGIKVTVYSQQRSLSGSLRRVGAELVFAEPFALAA